MVACWSSAVFLLVLFFFTVFFFADFWVALVIALPATFFVATLREGVFLAAPTRALVFLAVFLAVFFLAAVFLPAFFLVDAVALSATLPLAAVAVRFERVLDDDEVFLVVEAVLVEAFFFDVRV